MTDTRSELTSQLFCNTNTMSQIVSSKISHLTFPLRVTSSGLNCTKIVHQSQLRLIGGRMTPFRAFMLINAELERRGSYHFESVLNIGVCRDGEFGDLEIVLF